MTVIAWMDDWQMSARLAKLSTTYSYHLIFCENWQELPDSNTNMVLIIDLDKLKSTALDFIVKFCSKVKLFNFSIESKRVSCALEFNTEKINPINNNFFIFYSEIFTSIPSFTKAFPSIIILSLSVI